MLATDQTALLLDALRPPAGMDLDAAVGTTFTLDLAALLSIPVAASFRERDDGDAEPADLLETIRRHADRTVLFCQAGAIGIPPKYRRAMTFVERTVVEVRRPEHGIFHPKTWVVRFADGQRVHHRVLVMSRNLTFDRAWDVLVRLDEDQDAATVVETSELQALVAALPGMAARPMTTAQRALVADVLGSLGQARLAVPTPFTRGRVLAFHPGGRRGLPFRPACDHALAISPFLTSGATDSFLRTGEHWAGIVSRASALDGVASVLDGVTSVLRPKEILLSAERDVDSLLDDEVAVTQTEPALTMTGLHAKVYLQDDGDESVLWLGSANLTDAAFGRNVETLVELAGPVRQVGVDTVLSPTPRKDNLSWLVEEHRVSDGAVETESDELDAAQRLIIELASRRITLTLHPEADERWRAELEIDDVDALPIDVTLTAHLLSQPTDQAPIIDGRAAWSALAREHLTPFVVLSIRGAASASTLVRAHMIGDPPERRDAVLAAAITDTAAFLRYLAALLGSEVGGLLAGSGAGVPQGGWLGAGLAGARVLEDLLTTASRHPERLRTLDQTLRQLERHANVDAIIPVEFRALWRSVHEARREAFR